MDVHLKTKNARFSIPEIGKSLSAMFVIKRFLKNQNSWNTEKQSIQKWPKNRQDSECCFKNECWFRNDFEDIKEDNIKANENEKLIEKLVGLVEKLNERVSNLETPEKIIQ